MTQRSERETPRWRSRTMWVELLKLPPLVILGWLVGQGFTHGLPWVSVGAIVASLCLWASWLLGYTS